VTTMRSLFETVMKDFCPRISRIFTNEKKDSSALIRVDS
jgi:hypothetical protein